jgi:mannose-6-phosphate isomerase-like protein (cupin superfamily)
MTTTSIRTIGPDDGEISGPAGRTDRFMIDGTDTGGKLSVVEHTLAPHTLAGPLHRHTREDEYSYVLEGQLAALLGEEEVVAETGTLVFKPRNQWHTFWNPGGEPTRILELICPAGLEDLFRELGTMDDDDDPAVLPGLAASYGCELDFEGTELIMQQHGLTF